MSCDPVRSNQYRILLLLWINWGEKIVFSLKCSASFSKWTFRRIATDMLLSCRCTNNLEKHLETEQLRLSFSRKMSAPLLDVGLFLFVCFVLHISNFPPTDPTVISMCAHNELPITLNNASIHSIRNWFIWESDIWSDRCGRRGCHFGYLIVLCGYKQLTERYLGCVSRLFWEWKLKKKLN